jgi:hypothetical protein
VAALRTTELRVEDSACRFSVVLHIDATWTKLVAWYEARGFTVIAPRPTTTRPNAILFMSMDTVRHTLALAAAPSE